MLTPVAPGTHDRLPRAEPCRSHPPIRDKHARDWLIGARQEAIATGDIKAAVQPFLQEPL
jgi:hypothetical protein